MLESGSIGSEVDILVKPFQATSRDPVPATDDTVFFFSHQDRKKDKRVRAAANLKAELHQLDAIYHNFKAENGGPPNVHIV